MCSQIIKKIPLACKSFETETQKYFTFGYVINFPKEKSLKFSLEVYFRVQDEGYSRALLCASFVCLSVCLSV